MLKCRKNESNAIVRQKDEVRMIDFNRDIDLSIKYYTTSQYVLDKFKPIAIKRVIDPEDADFLVLDSESFSMEKQHNSKLIFSIDNTIDGCRAVISKTNIIAYLSMIDRMNSEEYFVSMADFSDVMRVSCGKLLHLSRYALNVSEEEIYANLPQEFTYENVGIIVFISNRDGHLLERVSGKINLMYPNGNIVIMMPAHESQHAELFVEVYVFESTVEEPIWT